MLCSHDDNTSHDKDTWKVRHEISTMNSMRQPVCKLWIAKIYEPKEMHAQKGDIKSLISLLIWINICISGEHGFFKSVHFPHKSWAEIRPGWRLFPCFSIFRPRESHNRTPFEEHSSPSWVSGSTEGMLAEPPSGDVAYRDRRLLLLLTQDHIKWKRGIVNFHYQHSCPCRKILLWHLTRPPDITWEKLQVQELRARRSRFSQEDENRFT